MADKKTIGVTPETRAVLEKLMTLDVFNDRMDIAKFAMAIAIKKGLPLDDVPGTDTAWGVGGFDDTGDVRNAIAVFYPENREPYRTAEILVNRGIVYIGERLGKNPTASALLALATK